MFPLPLRCVSRGGFLVEAGAAGVVQRRCRLVTHKSMLSPLASARLAKVWRASRDCRGRQLRPIGCQPASAGLGLDSLVRLVPGLLLAPILILEFVALHVLVEGIAQALVVTTAMR